MASFILEDIQFVLEAGSSGSSARLVKNGAVLGEALKKTPSRNIGKTIAIAAIVAGGLSGLLYGLWVWGYTQKEDIFAVLKSSARLKYDDKGVASYSEDDFDDYMRLSKNIFGDGLKEITKQEADGQTQVENLLKQLVGDELKTYSENAKLIKNLEANHTWWNWLKSWVYKADSEAYAKRYEELSKAYEKEELLTASIIKKFNPAAIAESMKVTTEQAEEISKMFTRVFDRSFFGWIYDQLTFWN